MSYFYKENGLFQGVIKDIDNNNKEDIVKLTVSKSAYPTVYPKENAIDFSNWETYWLSIDNEEFGQWLQIELTDRWVSLTHFAFKSEIGGYPLSFSFNVSTDGSTWETLYSQNNIHLMKTPQIISVPKRVARFFRWENHGRSAHEQEGHINVFRIALVDLYGTVTKCDGDCSSPPSFVKLPKLVKSCRSSHFTQFAFFWFISITK